MSDRVNSFACPDCGAVIEGSVHFQNHIWKYHGQRDELFDLRAQLATKDAQIARLREVLQGADDLLDYLASTEIRSVLSKTEQSNWAFTHRLVRDALVTPAETTE